MCIYIHYLLFTHSSVGHCSHVLATVSSAAMNTGYTYLSELEFSLNICPGVGLVDHKVKEFSI